MNKGLLVTMAVMLSITLSGCDGHIGVQASDYNTVMEETLTEAVTETTAPADTEAEETLTEAVTETTVPADTEAGTEQTEDGQALENMTASLQDSVYSMKFRAEKDMSGTDYSQNVIENEDEFILWTPEQLEYVRWHRGKAMENRGMPAFTPVELMDGIIRRRAIRSEDGLYIIVKAGGVEIWKDGSGVKLECGRPGPVDVVGHNEFWFQDVTGSGSNELLYKKYDGTMGEYMGCMWIIDLENMEAIEIEQDGDYFIEALKTFAENYENNGGSYVDGYEFYLTDKFNNAYSGLRFYVEDDSPQELYHKICIMYSKDRCQFVDGRYLAGSIKVIYRYDADSDSFVVDRVETYRYERETNEYVLVF